MNVLDINREEVPQTICTTLEQSRILRDLGLSAETSDMTWTSDIFTPKRIYGEDQYRLCCYPGAVTSQDPTGTPAWSTDAMLAQLPEYIEIDGNVCHIYIYRDFQHHWTILYECKGEGKGYAANTQANLRDCAFEMLKWYLTERHNLNTDEART